MRTLEKNPFPGSEEIQGEVSGYKEMVEVAKNRRILLAMLNS